MLRLAVLGSAFLDIGGAAHRPVEIGRRTDAGRNHLRRLAEQSEVSKVPQPGRQELLSLGEAVGADIVKPHLAAGSSEDERPARTDAASADDGDGICSHVDRLSPSRNLRIG